MYDASDTLESVAFTWRTEAIDDLPDDVEPYQVNQVLIGRKIRRWLSDEVLALWGATPARDPVYIVVFVSEGDETGQWWIEGARTMWPAERKWFVELMGDE